MTTFRRLALTSAVMTYVLVVIGAIVRSTGSGMGCPDWPTCHGSLIPPLGDTAAWIEWTHRSVAVVVGLLVLGLASMAVLRYRRQLSIVLPSVAALVLVVFQAYLGKITVDTNNAGEWVTAHLAAALALLGLLTFIAVRASYPLDLPARGASQRLTLLLAFTAASVYALMLFGSNVTATGAGLAGVPRLAAVQRPALADVLVRPGDGVAPDGPIPASHRGRARWPVAAWRDRTSIWRAVRVGAARAGSGAGRAVRAGAAGDSRRAVRRSR